MAKLIEPAITKGADWVDADGIIQAGENELAWIADLRTAPNAKNNLPFLLASPRVARSLVEMISFYKLACNRGDFGYPEQEAMAKRALDALLSAGYTESTDVK